MWERVATARASRWARPRPLPSAVAWMIRNRCSSSADTRRATWVSCAAGRGDRVSGLAVGQGSAPGTPAREGAVCGAPCGLQEEQALFVYPLGASRGPPVPSRHHLRGREARRQEATSEGGDILARQSRCPCQSSDLQATALPCNRLWPLY